MEVSTPFDAALGELLRAWRVRDDLRAAGDQDHAAIRRAFIDLDRARVLVRQMTADPAWRWLHADEDRRWLPAAATTRIDEISRGLHGAGLAGVDRHLDKLVARAREVHQRECLTLDPAGNTMNPRAEALMSSGIGTRPSLGHPGAKYETGLEALEEIDVVATRLACQVFGSRFAEVRVPSGSIANLYAFMAAARPGQPVIVPPASVGGHVTHHAAGAAGLYGLQVHPAPVDPARHTVDVAALRELATRVRPAVITIGGSLNLGRHPVAALREVADEVGAVLLFDAAHLSGVIAGGAWPSPLAEGAHLMTMSTYKSLAGPPGGLIVTDDELLAQRLDAIAHPGLTANFDLGKTAALAVTLLDWIEHGTAHARAMVDAAADLHRALRELGLPVVDPPSGRVVAHQLALDATDLGGGAAAAAHLRRANLLTSAIGLPSWDPEGGHGPPGVRVGTSELVRWGISGQAILQVAAFIGQAWRSEDPAHIAGRVARFRQEFTTLRFVR